MTALWAHDRAATATGGAATAPWDAFGVSIDSRSMEKGDLFVAIRGENHDGHDHVRDAFAKGAAAAMVAGSWKNPPSGVPLLVVEDTTQGLRDLARAARDRSQAQVVGITGSVGKTGTKEMLALVLAAQAPTASTLGNLNNHWGLPLSLARMPRDTHYGIFELGMNHPGEIEPLSRLLRPDLAIITTVEAVHLEFFENEDGIADAKAEIFAGVRKAGSVILNRDNRHFARLLDHAKRAGIGKIDSFGADPKSDFRLLGMTPDGNGSLVEASIDGERVDYRLGAAGRHLAINSLAVLGAVRRLNGNLHDAAQKLAEFSAMKGRGERREIETGAGSFLLIDESYNASPASMRAALEALGQSSCEPGGRRIAVLGDMLEIGAAAPELHAALADDIARNGIELVFAAGPNMAHLAAALPNHITTQHGQDSAAILPMVLAAVHPGDAVMVKGSLGSRMIPITDALIALDCTGGASPVPTTPEA